MEPIEIPEGIDAPPQFLLWSADELMPVVMSIAFGMAIGQVFICLVCSFGLVKIYRKYRDGKPDGFMLHAVYWYGFLPSKSKTVVNPFIKEFLP